jgi:lysophospholipase L1-like esterase
VQLAPSAYGWAFVMQARGGIYPQGIFETVGADEMLRKNPPVYFERNLRNMVAVARHWKIQPVLATFAASDQVVDPPFDSPTVAAALQEMNQLIAKLGRELEVPVFDFARVFPATPDLYIGAFHMSEKGARLQARMFADFLEDNELLPGQQ